MSLSHQVLSCSVSGTRPLSVGAGCAAGIGQQHQREQAGNLAIVRR